MTHMVFIITLLWHIRDMISRILLSIIEVWVVYDFTFRREFQYKMLDIDIYLYE